MAQAYTQDAVSLFCPFTPAINPAARWVQEETNAWATKFGILHTKQAIQQFERWKYGELMARAYPTAPPHILATIADWNTWLFLLDDQFDEQALGKNPEALQELVPQIIAVLAGAQPRAEMSAPLYALADVAQRLHAQAHPSTMQRLVKHLTESFTASTWEANNRLTKRVPTEYEYRKQRPFTGAVFCYLSLVEFARHFTLTDMVYNHPTVQRLSQLTNNCICWANDIMSIRKEQAAGDVHNLVYIVMHYRHYSQKQAVQYVAEMHNKDMYEFLTLSTNLPFFDEQIDLVLRNYVQGLQWWMRANIDWSAETSRYT